MPGGRSGDDVLAEVEEWIVEEAGLAVPMLAQRAVEDSLLGRAHGGTSQATSGGMVGKI